MFIYMPKWARVMEYEMMGIENGGGSVGVGEDSI